MNTLFLCAVVLCAAPPPATEAPDKPFTLNLSVNIRKDAKVYLELPLPEVGERWKIIGREDLRKNGKAILVQYDLAGIVIDDGKIVKLFFRLKKPEPEQEEAPKRYDASAKS
jgi:hypothetical protein